MTVVAGCLLGGIGTIGYSCAPKEEVHAEQASPSTTGSERCFSADLKGPVMVEVPAKGGTVTYCIDSTEVTLDNTKRL